MATCILNDNGYITLKDQQPITLSSLIISSISFSACGCGNSSNVNKKELILDATIKLFFYSFSNHLVFLSAKSSDQYFFKLIFV